MENLNKLSTGEKLIAAGAVVLLIASFLPWYDVAGGNDVADAFAEAFNVDLSRNGWQSPGQIWSILAVLVSVAMAGVILATKFGNVKLPDLGQFTWGQALAAGSGLVVLCILLKVIGESSSMAIGFFLGIIAAGAVAAGGYLVYTEERAGGVRPV